MTRPPRAPDARLFSPSMLVASVLQGVAALLVTSLVYLLAVQRGMPEDDVRTLTFFTLVLSNLGLIVANRSFRGHPFDFLAGGNRVLLGIQVLTIAFLAATVTIPPVRRLFGFGPLHLHDAAMVALACGLLSREEFDRLAEEQIIQAQAFGSWEEYAASLVCGALYWDFRQGTSLPDLRKAQRLWMDLVRTLLANDAAWDSGFWYVPKREKECRLWPSEMKMYLPDWEGPNGCFLTDRIAVDGCKVGWCYREEPETAFPDSGWRFFSGDESEDYIADIGHTGIYDLNTVCNLDPEVIPLLAAPYRSAFVRGEDGTFRPEPFDLPEN